MSQDTPQDILAVEQAQTPQKAPKKALKIKGHHWAGLVLLVAICGILAYAFYPKLLGQEEEGRQEDVQRPSATAKIEAVSVLPMAFPIRIEATGHLAAQRQAEISAETSGLIVARNTEEGRFVVAGQVLFQLDDRELRLSLREAQTELLKARSTFATQAIGYEAQRIDTTILIQARIQLREAQQRYRNGQISQVEWQNAQRSFEAKKLEFKSVYFGVLKRFELKSKIVQCGASRKNMIYKIVLSQTAFIFDNPVSFYTPNTVFDSHSGFRNRSVVFFLFFG